MKKILIILVALFSFLYVKADVIKMQSTELALKLYDYETQSWNDWSDWKDSMIQYYQDVLAEATTDTQKMILLNGEVIKQVKKAQLLGSEEYVRRVQLDYKANGGDMSDVDAWNEYLN